MLSTQTVARPVDKLQMVRFQSTLPPYLLQLYKSILEPSSKDLHHHTLALVDVMLGFLPLSPDQVLGFLTAQTTPLLAAADAVCKCWGENNTVKENPPSFGIMLCDKRLLKLNNHNVFYDVLTNKQSTGSKFLPIMTVSFAMAPTYAHILAGLPPKVVEAPPAE